MTLHRITTAVFLRAMKRHQFGAGDRIDDTLLACLLDLPGRIVSSDELMAAAYDGRADGGPIWAKKSVHLTIWSLRKQGVPIETHGNRGYSLTRSPTSSAALSPASASSTPRTRSRDAPYAAAR